MRFSSTILFASILSILATLAPTKAEACSYAEADSRYFQHEAPPGGVFFVREEVAFDSAARPSLPDGTLVDEAGNTYPIEVVSSVANAYAIRVPDVAPGTILAIQDVALELSWSADFGEQAYSPELVVTAPNASLPTRAPVLGNVAVDVVETTRQQPQATFPLFWDASSCGTPPGPGIYTDVTEFEGQVRIRGDLLDGRHIVVDGWTTAPGQRIDAEQDTPDFAAVAAPSFRGFGQIFTDDDNGDVVIAFPNFDAATDAFDFHLRIRDSGNGLASEIVTLSLNVPSPTTAGGCSQTGDQSSTWALSLVLLGFGLIRRRRRA